MPRLGARGASTPGAPTSAPGHHRAGSPLDRVLPGVYAAAALAMIAFLLPTALRPPQPPPPTSAEFSPDAPPDDSEVLLTELSRGSSSTAGAGVLGDSGPAVGPERPRSPDLRPSKGKCFGEPPRQTESLYSPPCVPAFVGPNGGATHRGVSDNEVRIGLLLGGTGYQGPVDQQDRAGEGADARTYRVWQDYLNERFEFYGRKLRLYVVRSGSRQWQEGSNARAAVQRADAEYKVFGFLNNVASPPAEDEALKRGLVTFTGTHHPIERYQKFDPLAWSFWMDGSMLTRLSAEFMCKQLVGNKVSFSGDPTLNGTDRKFAALTYHDVSYYGYDLLFEREFKQECGASLTMRQTYNLDDQTDQLAAVMTKFRAAGVTTIWCGCDGVSPIVFTAVADQQGYYPEWIHPGSAGIADNGTAALYQSRTQWKNSIGITSYEMATTRGSDGYRAYKEMDPQGEPDGGNFGQLLQLAGGIQMAGPKLTPQTFKEGLWKRWPQRPPAPNWAIGGGYGPGDWTYSDYVALEWWDPSAPRPGTTNRGAYRFLFNGKRFKLGELPKGWLVDHWFKPDKGITQPPEEEAV